MKEDTCNGTINIKYMLNILVFIIALGIPGFAFGHKSNILMSPAASFDFGLHGVMLPDSRIIGNYYLVPDKKKYGVWMIKYNTTEHGFILFPAEPSDHKIKQSTYDEISAKMDKITSVVMRDQNQYIPIYVKKSSNRTIVIYDKLRVYKSGLRGMLGKIMVKSDKCSGTWNSRSMFILSYQVFIKNNINYLSLILYSNGVDGSSPAIRIFNLSDFCIGK